MDNVWFFRFLFTLRTSVVDTDVLNHLYGGRNVFQLFTDDLFPDHFQRSSSYGAELLLIRQRYFDPFHGKVLCLFLECCFWFPDMGSHRYLCSRQDSRLLLFRFIKESQLSVSFGYMFFTGSAEEFPLHIIQLFIQKPDLDSQFRHLGVAVF